MQTVTTTKSIQIVKKELHILAELVDSSSLVSTSPIPDSSNIKTLQTTYEAKEYLRLKQIFTDSGHIKRVLRLIFDNVITFWASAFTESERVSLIYTWVYHCPAIDVLYALSETLTQIHSRSVSSKPKDESVLARLVVPTSSVSDSTTKEHAHQLSTLILRFFGLIKVDSEPGMIKVLREVLRLTSSSPVASQTSSTWNQLLSLVCNIPDKIFNLLKKQTDHRFKAEIFFSELTKHLATLLPILPSSLPYFSIWIAKLDSIGKIDLAITSFDPMHFAKSTPDATNGLTTIVAPVFENIPSISIERAIIAFLSNKRVQEDRYLAETLIKCFSKLFGASTTARFVLTEKIFVTVSLPWWILRNVIDFLYRARKNAESDFSNWWLDCLDKMATTAGSSRFVKNEPYLRQRRLNRCLVYVLEKGYVSKEDLEVSQFMMSLMAAVQELLAQPTGRLMSLGMRLGEAFSKILDPANALQFDGPRKDEDDEPDDAPLSAESEENANQSANFELADFASDSTNTLYFNPMQDYFSFLDTIYGVSDSKRRLGDENQKFRKGKFIQSSLDDDLSDVSEVKTPLYLRDCMNALRSDDPKQLEVVLRVLAPLIASRPHDLTELSQSLASTLLHVVNNYELENFDTQKMDALAALIEYEPARVIPYLVVEFYASNYSIHERYVILDSLCDAAQALSEHKVDPRPDFNPVAMRALKFQRPATTSSTQIEFLDTQKAPIKPAGTSRRFASERKTIETFKNRLAPYISQLMALLNYNEPPSRFKLLMGEPRLLGKLMYAISVFIDCAGVSITNYETVAKSILETTWKLRYHEDPFVRRALLLANGALVRNAPAWVLFEAMTAEMNELVAWLENNQEDADEEVRVLSMTVLMQLGKIYKENPQYRPFEAPN